MGVFLPVLVIIIYVALIIKKNNDASKKDVASKTTQYKKTLQNNRPVKVVSPSASAYAPKKQKAVKAASISSIMEDRDNDWLANQLRDEHRAFKNTKDMFDLKIEHSSHCDAQYLKQMHNRTCNTNKIDTAEGLSSF